MHLHFLPWAGKLAMQTIGPVTLTPWRDLRTTIHAKPRDFFDHYFTRYLDHSQTPVTEITIATITTDPLAEITADQRATIRRAIDALTFACIIPNLDIRISTGNHVGIPNSERFTLITQVTDLRPGIAVSTRGVTHAWGINQVHFCMPWAAGTKEYQTNRDLLAGLGSVLNNHLGTDTRNRLSRTIEWFRLAHTGSDETSNASRLVMMSTAFETLLEPDNPHEKSAPMAARLHELTNDPHLASTAIKIGKKT